MNEPELNQFEIELERLAPARPPEELLARVNAEFRAQPAQGAIAMERGCLSNAETESVAERFPRILVERALAAEAATLRARRLLLRWVGAAACGLILVVAVLFRHGPTPSQKPPRPPLASTGAAAKADDVEIQRQWVASFDAVARLPGGEPVRFRCQEWIEDMVWRDAARGVEVEHRTPTLEIVPVDFETF